MKIMVCSAIATFLLAISTAAADVLVRTSEPIVSVSDTASFSLSDPPPYALSAQFSYAFSNLYFNPGDGTLNSVTAEFDVSIPVFVSGTSQSVFAPGETATMAIGGTAGAQLRLESAVLNTAGVPYSTDCTVSGNGDGIPDRCLIGDGATIESTPAAVLTINYAQSFTGAELAPFLINDGESRMFLDVELSGVASGDVSSALIWARTFGTPGARVLLTLTFDYTPGAADADADGIADSTDNCTAVYNADQFDVNGDGIGNICDADITGPGDIEDCSVNFLDVQAFKNAIFSTPAAANWNPEADVDGSGAINFADIQVLKTQLFGPPGPSASGCN